MREKSKYSTAEGPEHVHMVSPIWTQNMAVQRAFSKQKLQNKQTKQKELTATIYVTCKTEQIKKTNIPITKKDKMQSGKIHFPFLSEWFLTRWPNSLPRTLFLVNSPPSGKGKKKKRSVLKFRNRTVGCFHFSWFLSMSTFVNISRLALNKALCNLQTSFTSPSSANASRIDALLTLHVWRLVCHGSQGEREMYLVPRATPPNWKVEASCGTFQIASAYSSLLLMELRVCLLKALCLFASLCPCFAFQVLSLRSVVLPFTNTLESVQSAAGGRHLPVLILCRTVSKLTDGAVSSIWSVNSSREDRMWMEHFSLLSSQKKAAPIYLLL